LVEESTIQRRYTLTIPKKIRESVGIKEGEKVFWRVENGEIVITPKTFEIFHARFPGASGYISEKDKQDVEEAFLRETG
jgi:AbrB family looped-hinge helix DNA binding protein